MTLRGVRSSWLILARNALLARLADSAWSRATTSSAVRCSTTCSKCSLYCRSVCKMWPTGAAAVSVSCTRLAHISNGGLSGAVGRTLLGPCRNAKISRTAKTYPCSPERFSEPQQPRCQNRQRDIESRAGDLDRTVDGDVIGGVHPLAGQVHVGGLPEMTKAKKNQSCYRNQVGHDNESQPDQSGH